MTENIKKQVEIINGLNKIVRQRYGENAVEALIGALASVCTSKQLEALFDHWSKK